MVDKAIISLCEVLALLFGLPFGEDLYRGTRITYQHLFYLAIGLIFAVGGPMTVYFLRGQPQSATDVRRASRLFISGWYLIVFSVAVILLWLLRGGDNSDVLIALVPLLLGIVLASVPILYIGAYFPTLRLLASRKKQALYISTGLAVTVVLLLQSYRLQSEFNAYVRPRSVTDAQAEHLKSALSGVPPPTHDVFVKVDPNNQEALEYAGELTNALSNAGWHSRLDTSSAEPRPVSPGVCLSTTGENTTGIEQANNLKSQLQNAFYAADIPINCSSGASAGNFALYLLVGPRPLVIAKPSIIMTIGRWLLSYGMQHNY